MQYINTCFGVIGIFCIGVSSGTSGPAVEISPDDVGSFLSFDCSIELLAQELLKKVNWNEKRNIL
jgi:hypothetical protein